MRKLIAAAVSISLLVLSPGIEPYRLFAAGPVSGAAAAPGGSWAGVLGAVGAPLQARFTGRYGADSPLAEFAGLDFSSRKGRFLAQPVFDQLKAMGVSPDAFAAAAIEQREALLEKAFAGASEAEYARFDAIFKTRAESVSESRLKSMDKELSRLWERGFLYLDGESHEQVAFKQEAVRQQISAGHQQRTKKSVADGTKDWTPSSSMALGVVADPTPLLRGKTIALTEWKHFAFSVESDSQDGLGDATIDGKAAAESELEYKHIVRRTPQGRYRHDYSFLAIGATPAGTYQVAFPPTAFSVVVSHRDKSTPQQRLAGTLKMAREVFSKEDPPLAVGPGVSEPVQRFLRPHLSIMGRHLGKYESYLTKDPVLTAAERADRLAELARLRAFYADAVAGRSRYGLEALVAQVMARESSILRAYRLYLHADPAEGRVAEQLTLDQLDRYQEILVTLHKAAPALDAEKEAGPVMKTVYAVVGAWSAIRGWVAQARLKLWLHFWPGPKDKKGGAGNGAAGNARKASPEPSEAKPLFQRISEWWKNRQGVEASIMERPRFPSLGGSRGPSGRDPGGRDGPGSQVPESEPGLMPNPDDKTRLSDIAGQEEAKEEFMKILDWLKNPAAYAKVGGKGYKGVLEYGPPGTGKTLFARAVANEIGIPFIYKAGSEFDQELVGVGAKRVRELKDQALQAARELEEREKFEYQRQGRKPPQKTYGAVIFIDEIETIGKKRGSATGSDNAQTLNQLLTEMDGFVQDPEHPILWIAATNMPEVLDPALTRGGRFELQIPIGLPDVAGREGIFKVHTRNKPLAEDVDLKTLARHTAGLAGADIEAIVNDAAMTVGRERRAAIAMKDLESSIDRFGPGGAARPKVMSPAQKAIIAAHESGHALATLLVPNGAPLRKLTIIAHGLHALGFSQQMEEEETFVKSKEWYEDQIAIALAGRAGELLATGKIYSGASNDFEKATYYATLMVTKFGMSDKIGHVIFDRQGDKSLTGHRAGEQTEAVINAEVARIIGEQSARAKKLLEDNRETFERMQKDLMEKETLRQEDFEAYQARGPKKS